MEFVREQWIVNHNWSSWTINGDFFRTPNALRKNALPLGWLHCPIPVWYSKISSCLNICVSSRTSWIKQRDLLNSSIQNLFEKRQVWSMPEGEQYRNVCAISILLIARCSFHPIKRNVWSAMNPFADKLSANASHSQTWCADQQFDTKKASPLDQQTA
jgi:hypothetical protein